MQIEFRGLPRDRIYDMRMAVTDVRDVVVGVEVPTPIGVLNPNSVAANDVHGTVVEQRRISSKDAESAVQETVVRHQRPFDWFG